jgi:DNA-binding MarR family transcriptional regulator
VHPSHFAILNHLTLRGDGKEPARMAAAMQVTKATMTHSLKVLGSHGFIETRPNPEDARGKLVFLTDKGRAFRGEAIKRASERLSDVIGESMHDDMIRLLPDLVRIRKHLDDNR